jgi:hypothetical protein
VRTYSAPFGCHNTCGCAVRYSLYNRRKKLDKMRAKTACQDCVDDRALTISQVLKTGHRLCTPLYEASPAQLPHHGLNPIRPAGTMKHPQAPPSITAHLPQPAPTTSPL